MADKKDEPQELSELEEAIMDFLYTNPTPDYGTYALRKYLKRKPENATEAQERQAFREVQYGIETLIVAKLVKGKRLSGHSNEVYFEELVLTPAGEAKAIVIRRGKGKK